MPCHTGLWWGPGGHSPKKVTSLHVLQRSRSLQLSILRHSSAPTISRGSLLGGAGLCSSISSAVAVFPSLNLSPLRPHAALLCLSHLLQTSSLHVNSFLHPFSPPSFQCLAQNFLCDLIPHPSCDALASTIFASSPLSFTFFLLSSLFSQGKSSL